MIDQSIVQINANLRENVGTGSSRTLRRNDAIPAVVYGKGRNPISIALSNKEFLIKYKSAALSTHLIELEIGNKKEYVLMRDVQKHPVTSKIQHVDFQFIDYSTKIKVEVPLIFTNEHKCIGIKRGGVLNILHRTLSIKCSPKAILQNIEIDLSDLTAGHSVHVSDLNLPSEINVVMKEDDPAIVTISSTSTEKEDQKNNQDSTATASPES